MVERIKKVMEEALAKSGADLKDTLFAMSKIIQEADVDDLVELFEESSDLIVKVIPKVGEFMAAVEPSEGIPVVKDTVPVILDKMRKCGIGKLISVIPVNKLTYFPIDIMKSIEDAIRICGDKITIYLADPDLKNQLIENFLPITINLIENRGAGIEAIIRAIPDFEIAFNKIRDASITANVDISKANLILNIKIDKGTISIEMCENPNADLSFEFPDAKIVEIPVVRNMIDQLESGQTIDLSAAKNKIESNQLKITGFIFRTIKLMPLLTPIIKVMQKK